MMMRLRNWLLLTFLLPFLVLPMRAQNSALTGFCQQGATSAILSGLQSTNKLQGVIPSCTVTVYLTGTTTLATIYANGGGSALSNPFTASAIGQWTFYAAGSNVYDVVLSGGIFPNVYASPVTLVGGGGGGGGGGGIAVLLNPTGGQTVTQPAGTSLSVDDTGLFDNLFHAPIQGIVAGASPAAVSTYFTSAGLNYDGVAGAVDATNAAQYQVDGQSGYVLCDNATTNCVGNAGYTVNRISGGHVWGNNLGVLDSNTAYTGGAAGQMYGSEIDVQPYHPFANYYGPSAVLGQYMVMDVFNSPGSLKQMGYAYDIVSQEEATNGAQWLIGTNYANGCCLIGAAFGSTSNNAPANSQQIEMTAIDGVTFPATAFSIDSANNVTVTATNTLTVGRTVILSGFTIGTYLNTAGILNVTAATGSSFVASSSTFTHAAVATTTDAGTVAHGPYNTFVYTTYADGNYTIVPPPGGYAVIQGKGLNIANGDVNANKFSAISITPSDNGIFSGLNTTAACSSCFAFESYTANTTQWATSFRSLPGATAIGAWYGQAAASGTSVSQMIRLDSTNSSSATIPFYIGTDATGNLDLSPNTSSLGVVVTQGNLTLNNGILAAGQFSVTGTGPATFTATNYLFTGLASSAKAPICATTTGQLYLGSNTAGAVPCP